MEGRDPPFPLLTPEMKTLFPPSLLPVWTEQAVRKPDVPLFFLFFSATSRDTRLVDDSFGLPFLSPPPPRDQTGSHAPFFSLFFSLLYSTAKFPARRAAATRRTPAGAAFFPRSTDQIRPFLLTPFFSSFSRSRRWPYHGRTDALPGPPYPFPFFPFFLSERSAIALLRCLPPPLLLPDSGKRFR